jgi:hypothetical protein
LFEAQQRSGLVAELFSILQSLSLLQAEGTGTTTQVPRGLKGRIVALSRAATPYRNIEVPEDTEEDNKVPVPRLANDRIMRLERAEDKGIEDHPPDLAQGGMAPDQLVEAVALVRAERVGCSLKTVGEPHSGSWPLRTGGDKVDHHA